jgi:hypothetical protein
MIDRNAAAAAEIATLRQKLAAAEARIREIEDFTWWRSDKAKSTPRLDELRECMAALDCEITTWSGSSTG